MKWIGVIFVTLFFVAPAQAVTLDQLAAMRITIRAELDGTTVCPKVMGKLSRRARNALPMGLEAKIREELASMSKKDRKKFFTQKRVAECATSCACGIYADWIGTAGIFNDKRRDLVATERRRPLDKAAVAGCARASQKWVCEHPLFKEVVKSVKQDAEGAAR